MHYGKSNRLGQNEKVMCLDFVCDIIFLFCFVKMRHGLGLYY